MEQRSLNLVTSFDDEIEVTDEKMNEIRNSFEGKIKSIDGIFYKCISCKTKRRSNGRNQTISHLMLESVEGKELEEILSKEREKSGVQLLNIPAFIYELNESYKNIVGIFPLQQGEQFLKFLTDDLCLEEQYIVYPENLESRISFDDEFKEWEFEEYKWLVKIREETGYGYSECYYAFVDLNNLNKI